MQILAVEDEVAMAELLQSALSEEGHFVTLANDGEIAFELARSTRFDLIILDLMLPRKDGFEVARQLRRANIRTPVLVLTARDAPADIVRALDQGADDYLTKPFALEVLLGAGTGSKPARRHPWLSLPAGGRSDPRYCEPGSKAR